MRRSPALRRRLTVEERAQLFEAADELAQEPRPRSRNECRHGERPCPWAGCRYHLAFDVTGAGALVPTPVALDATLPTCALDVADDGGHTLQEVGSLLGVSRERARQIEGVALDQLRLALAKLEDTNARGVAAPGVQSNR